MAQHSQPARPPTLAPPHHSRRDVLWPIGAIDSGEACWAAGPIYPRGTRRRVHDDNLGGRAVCADALHSNSHQGAHLPRGGTHCRVSPQCKLLQAVGVRRPGEVCSGWCAAWQARHAAAVALALGLQSEHSTAHHSTPLHLHGTVAGAGADVGVQVLPRCARALPGRKGVAGRLDQGQRAYGAGSASGAARVGISAVHPHSSGQVGEGRQGGGFICHSHSCHHLACRAAEVGLRRGETCRCAFRQAGCGMEDPLSHSSSR